MLGTSVIWLSCKRRSSPGRSGAAAFGRKNLPRREPSAEGGRMGGGSPPVRSTGFVEGGKIHPGEPPVPAGPPPGQVFSPKADTDAGREDSRLRALL
jgi:hypothetical protein